MKNTTVERMLQSQGFGTRRECRSLVLDGRVTLNGEPCDDPQQRISPEGLPFTVDDESWVCHEKVYLMLHKPAGYECSRLPTYHPSVFALLPPQLVARGVQCVGRLDEDTTGLLLLTDDGQFIHAMGSGKRKVPKVYEVTIKHPMSDAQIAQLLAGVQLHDEPEPVAASACERIDEQHIRLTLTSGKYHQVKRMVAAVENRVEALHRSVVGEWTLPPDLPIGKWQWIHPQT